MIKANQLVGKTFENKYKLEDKIGEGGMAVVYKAYQSNLNRYVAIKIIKENFSKDNTLVQAFINEAKILAQCSHDNIIKIMDFGEYEGLYYIIMEYLEGATLDYIIHKNKKIELADMLNWIGPIASALHNIHSNDLIHRDVKSANIFITNDGKPVLMDFGIAGYKRNIEGGPNINYGTAEYMSPEQINNKNLDGTSDLYSLGIVMYECITGQVPFTGEAPHEVIQTALNESPVPPSKKEPNVPKWIDYMVLSLLSKNSDERPKSGLELVETINRRSHKRKLASTGQRIRLNKKSWIILIVVLMLATIIPVITFFSDTEKRVEVNHDKVVQDAVHAEKFFDEGKYIPAFRALQQKKGRSEPLSGKDKEMLDECYQHIREMTLGNKLVFISGGSFVMGDDDGGEDEKPAREVTVSGFEISKYEITNQQFVNFLNAINCHADGSINGNILINLQEHAMIIYDAVNECFDVVDQAEEYPVTGVTWYGADLFCHFFKGRLQTEAEWEYIASFVQNQNERIDADSLQKMAWFNINADQRLHPVGSLEPDINGVYDLFGNVFEWCYDYYDKDYYKKSENIDPMGPPSGYTKVIRGGDVNSPVDILTKGFRYNADMNGLSGDNIGFRICFPKN